MEAGIYIAIDSAAPRPSYKNYGYVLECKVDGETKTREGFGGCHGSYHQAVLKALIEAMERFKETCRITIYTEDSFVANMIKQNLDRWVSNGFVTAKGKPVANQELWIELWELIAGYDIEITVGEHSYSGWILAQIEEKRRERKQDV